MLLDLQPADLGQGELAWQDPSDSLPAQGQARLMQALERIEQRHGRGAVHLASGSLKGEVAPVWRMKQGRRTPGYTTDWEGLAIARC